MVQYTNTVTALHDIFETNEYSTSFTENISVKGANLSFELCVYSENVLSYTLMVESTSGTLFSTINKTFYFLRTESEMFWIDISLFHESRTEHGRKER